MTDREHLAPLRALVAALTDSGSGEATRRDTSGVAPSRGDSGRLDEGGIDE